MIMEIKNFYITSIEKLVEIFKFIKLENPLVLLVKIIYILGLCIFYLMHALVIPFTVFLLGLIIYNLF